MKLRYKILNGVLASAIDKCFTLSETEKAVAYSETGRARGKIIILME